MKSDQYATAKDESSQYRTSALGTRVKDSMKEEFQAVCFALDRAPAQMLRILVRDFIEQNRHLIVRERR